MKEEAGVIVESTDEGWVAFGSFLVIQVAELAENTFTEVVELPSGNIGYHIVVAFKLNDINLHNSFKCMKASFPPLVPDLQMHCSSSITSGDVHSELAS